MSHSHVHWNICFFNSPHSNKIVPLDRRQSPIFGNWFHSLISFQLDQPLELNWSNALKQQQCLPVSPSFPVSQLFWRLSVKMNNRVELNRNRTIAPLCILAFWLAACTLASVAAVFPERFLLLFCCHFDFFPAIANKQFICSWQETPTKETKHGLQQKLRDATTAIVGLAASYIAADGKLVIKKTKINGNIHAGIYLQKQSQTKKSK